MESEKQIGRKQRKSKRKREWERARKRLKRREKRDHLMHSKLSEPHKAPF